MSEQMISIIFPDGSKKEYRKGITLEEIAASIRSSLKKESSSRESE